MTDLKTALISFGFITCLVVILDQKEATKIQTYSTTGVLLSEYVFPKKIEVIDSLLIKSDDFNEHILVISDRGYIYDFDLPFMQDGRQIMSQIEQDIQIQKILLLNNKRTLLLQDQFKYIDVLTLI